MKVLLIANSAENVAVHRALLIEQLLAHGFDVHVAVPEPIPNDFSVPGGATIHTFRMSRRGTHIWQELRSLCDLIRIVRKLCPEIVHAFTMKPVLYGAIAARQIGVRRILCSLTGLGDSFADNSRPMLRSKIERALRFAFSSSKCLVIVQNEGDRQVVLEKQLVSGERLILIPGSGVDDERFAPMPEPQGDITVVLAARLIAQKGVREFMTAGRLLRQRGVKLHLALVGDVDPGNAQSLSREEVEAAVKDGIVEWWGWQQDMREVLAKAHIACLPTYYGEGLPRFVMEAAAVGRAIVVADNAGCREVISHLQNGIIVRPRDPIALADALEWLAKEPGERARLGAAARAHVEKELSAKRFGARMLALYRGA